MTIELVMRTSVFLAAAWAACRLLPRATAATRHLVWHLAVVVVLVAPLAQPFALGIQLPAIPRVAAILAVPPGTPEKGARPQSATAYRTQPLPGAWPLFSAAGSAILLLWVAAGYFAAGRTVRRARQAPADLQAVADALATRPGHLLIGAKGEGPFVHGVVSPSIVLPADAERWDADRLRAVLLHELAHVRRGDCRAQLLAQIACAVYWFNPLVWIAARGLRIERERACDDEVLARGALASTYAADLLDLACTRRLRPASSAVLAMARPSELEGRLLAILAPRRNRVAARPTRYVVTLAVVALAVLALGARSAGGFSQDVASPTRSTALTALARDDDPERAAVKLALDSSADAIPGLLAALQDPNPQVREKAALGLGWRSDDRVVAPLIAALRDDDAQVREKAAIALGSTGNPRAVAPLEQALADPDSQVREKAAAGLTLFRLGGDPDANGQHVRESLGAIVNGLLRLTEKR